MTDITYPVETFKLEGDSESASAVADKKVKYEGGGMAAASFYGSPAATAAGAISVKEERREPALAHPDVSVIEDDDDGVEDGGERAKGKGEMEWMSRKWVVKPFTVFTQPNLRYFTSDIN